MAWPSSEELSKIGKKPETITVSFTKEEYDRLLEILNNITKYEHDNKIDGNIRIEMLSRQREADDKRIAEIQEDVRRLDLTTSVLGKILKAGDNNG